MPETSSLLDEADSRFFLDLYRCAVSLYQPKIEKRTGVALGNIDVWEYRLLDEHAMRDLRRATFRGLRGWFRWLLPRARLQQVARFQQISEHLRATYTDRARGCVACYYGSAIYVSFEGDIRWHEEGIACAVVHELSHALWYRLAGEPSIKEWTGAPSERQELRLIVEGYATYAERIWFRDLYHPCVRRSLKWLCPSFQSVHYRGMQRIQKLVERFGPDILLRLPRQWRDISKQADGSLPT